MVAVLVERMLPPALADNAQQYLFTWMHMGIAVIGLVRILERIVGVHVVGHGASVNHEVCGMIGLSRDLEAASRSSSRAVTQRCDLRQCLAMNDGIHFGELEQVFPVVAALGVIVGG